MYKENIKRICNKYSVEEVADKVVQYFKLIDDTAKDIPEFFMITFTILSSNDRINKTSKFEIINFLNKIIKEYGDKENNSPEGLGD